MTSILGTETHRYDFDESSGQVLDKVGSADSTTIRGTPLRTGFSWILDGVADSPRWSLANKIFDISADMTFYVKLKLLETPIDTFLRLYGGISDDNKAPGAQWNDQIGTNLMQILVPSSPPAKVDVDIGRDPGINEIFIMIWSYVVSSKGLKAVIKSDNGIDHNGTATGSIDPTVQGFDLGESFGEFGNIEVFQMGTVNGTAHSLEDLQDTATALLGLSFEQIQQNKRQLIVDGSRRLRV